MLFDPPRLGKVYTTKTNWFKGELQVSSVLYCAKSNNNWPLESASLEAEDYKLTFWFHGVRKNRVYQTSVAPSPHLCLRSAALGSLRRSSITNLNRQLTFPQLSCIVGSIGTMFYSISFDLISFKLVIVSINVLKNKITLVNIGTAMASLLCKWSRTHGSNHTFLIS